LGSEEEQPRLAVLQKFRDISRVMTDTFLKTKKKNPSGQQPDVSTKQKQQQDYAQKMISIMKEMQSLCLNVEVLNGAGEPVSLRDNDDEADRAASELGINISTRFETTSIDEI
jgi:hypothetical protein